MQRKQSRTRQLGIVGTLASFVLVLMFLMMALLLIGAGYQAYTAIEDTVSTTAQCRNALLYVSGKLRQVDAGDEMAIVQGENGAPDMLCVYSAFDGETYVTQIFLSQGVLYERFVSQEEDVGEAMGERVGEIADFQLEGSNPVRIKVTLNNGQTQEMYVALRTKAVTK